MTTTQRHTISAKYIHISANTLPLPTYAVANLETTLRGTEDGAKYSGYPTFNCPDSIVTATKTPALICCLRQITTRMTKGLKGFLRTLDVIDSEGIDRIGTMKTEEESKYTVKDINGIKIGMTCYTYETETGKEGRKALNGIMLATEATNLINSFSYERLDAFYTDLKGQLDGMKAQGSRGYGRLYTLGRRIPPNSQ